MSLKRCSSRASVRLENLDAISVNFISMSNILLYSDCERIRQIDCLKCQIKMTPESEISALYLHV